MVILLQLCNNITSIVTLRRVMSPSPDENLILMKQLFAVLEGQRDDIREAVVKAHEYRKMHARQDYIRAHPQLARGCMMIAFHEAFAESGLGGMSFLDSNFPQQLHFSNEQATLILRREAGLRRIQPGESSQLELLPSKPRAVLLWDWTTNPNVDVLKCFGLQLFDGEDELEKAEVLSKRIPLLRSTDELSLQDFNPNRHDNLELNYGD